ncbi:TetR/AcrR family transcriptional regulator [[Mycobacterium] burgundiense]|uniref:TetR/AcrR family transcriptional regulator n=1 Tax=[Mycobacterium] burgundiense TaxID=3064286 RepID=A0ABM9L8C6_9MYCO|nr:TetR/AcrR family transcriptional regulator [Mycolicibacterium sp. MU0053]CAJ1494554.1 TetR/AcrR family transcriptional regulator [Mycolicibacterium sp. MU0053]
MTTVGPVRANRGRRPSRPSGDDREQAILATARRLLEERAFAEISVVDLAKGAGLSRPTFYFYFPSKEAVLLSLLDPLIQHADTGLSDISAVPADPRRAFRDGIDTFYSAFASDPVLTRAGAEAISTNPEVRALWSGFMQKWIDQTAALIAAERGRGAAPDTLPARELATALNQMNERAMIAAISEESGAVPADRLVDTLTHIWMTSIYGPA